MHRCLVALAAAGLLHGPLALGAEAVPEGSAHSSAGDGLRWVAKGGERLSDLISNTPSPSARVGAANGSVNGAALGALHADQLASPYTLRWHSQSEKPAQRRALQDLIAGMQAAQVGAAARWIGWLTAAPETGRVRLPLQDPQLLQLHPRFDPVMQAGDTAWWPTANAPALGDAGPPTALARGDTGLPTAPARGGAGPAPARVRTLWADGSACSVPYRPIATANDYLNACAPGGQRRTSQAWLVQPDGEVLAVALDPWVAHARTAPAPGAWIWLAEWPSSTTPNGSTPGLQRSWPEPLAQAMASWLATQGPHLPAPGPERVLATEPQVTAQPSRLANSLSAGDWGGIGLLQTPTARMLSAGHVGFGVSRSQPYTHFNLSVQPFEGVEGVMRYTRVQGRLYGPEIAGDRAYLDKSLEVKLRLADETVVLPAMALGLRDPLGTGLFGGEYLVASKHLGGGTWGHWDASLGLGWGYSGAAQNLANPLARMASRFATRQESEVGQGGLARVRSWFTGRTALFGGVQWQDPTLPLVLKAEWDGNDYQHEPSTTYRFNSRSRANVGWVWHSGPTAWTLAWQRGQALALNFSVQTDISALRYSAIASNSGMSGQLVSSWANEFSDEPNDANSAAPARALLLALARATGWLTQGLREEGNTWVLQVERAGGVLLRERLHAVAELLHAVAPAHLQAFEVQATVLGVEVSRHRIDRRLWAQAQDQWLPPSARRDAFSLVTPTAPNASASTLSNGSATANTLVPQRWLWQITPGWQQTMGGPDGLLYALSARASTHLPLWRGAWLNGAAALRVADNYGHYQYTAPSGLPRVRTYTREYQTSAALTLPNLQVNQLIALGSKAHALFYGGLLEPMFAGVGAELLVRPAGANWAVGADWNAVRQRDFSQNLRLRDYHVTTGHVSALWSTGWAGVEVSAQAGRYLAGDVGGTLNLSRAFANGSRMGLWVTKTKVSAQQFGEGSFDKGVYVSVPFELLLGRPAGGSASVVWQPLIRDGGARLSKAQSLWGLTALREPLALTYANPPAPAVWATGTAP